MPRLANRVADSSVTDSPAETRHRAPVPQLAIADRRSVLTIPRVLRFPVSCVSMVQNCGARAHSRLRRRHDDPRVAGGPGSIGSRNRVARCARKCNEKAWRATRESSDRSLWHRNCARDTTSLVSGAFSMPRSAKHGGGKYSRPVGSSGACVRLSTGCALPRNAPDCNTVDTTRECHPQS
jgi:hypothetical protein